MQDERTPLLTNDGFKKALAVLFSAHQQLEPKEAKEFIYKAWYRMLRDISDAVLMEAVTRFVTEKTTLFPGDNFIALIRQIAVPSLIETEGDAIELAFEAVSLFGYVREKDAMVWLKERSPLIAAVVRRFGFLEICKSEEPDVVRGQLRAIFKGERDRAKIHGGIVESATHLGSGLPDSEKLIGLTQNIGKGRKALSEVKRAA